MSTGSLPTFLGIGTFKSATTWLYDALSEHPDVFLPAFKELHFFTNKTFGPTDLWTSKGLDWYRELFADGAAFRARGEISPGYLSDPDAARRIHQALPDVRLIALLRHPAERAWSHYWFRRGKARVGYEFEELVRRPGFDPDGFIKMGRYAEHLSLYRELFGAAPLLVRLMEDVQEDASKVWRDVCAHIDVAAEPIPEAVFRRANPSRSRRSKAVYQAKRLVSGALTRSGLFRVHQALKQTAVPRLIDRLNDRPGKNPELAPELRDALVTEYREDILRLQDLLDRDLGRWLE